jgi:hypothetical protein
MATKWSAKDPADIADYFFDWTEFLPEGEIITEATVTVPTGVIGVIDDIDPDTSRIVRVRLSGGTADENYPIDCLITTDAGQAFEMTSVLKVKERIKT